MNTTLVIFSGLPGTGKSTLARLVAQHLQLPLLGIDDVVDAVPAHMRAHAHPFWEDMIAILLALVESQLERGLSTIVDSVFMGDDRLIARDLARRHGAAFRPIHTFVSDERVWEARVRRRAAEAPPEIRDEIATWERLQVQRKDFLPWKPGSALFVDNVQPLEHAFERVLTFVKASTVNLVPL